MARINISIPDELSERLAEWRDQINTSAILREGLEEEINRLTLLKQKNKPHTWKTDRYENNSVTVNADQGEYGATNWTIQIETDELKNPTTVKLGASTKLDEIIRGINDYHHTVKNQQKGIIIQEKLPKNKIIDLWIKLGQWACDQNIDLQADVALLASKSLRVK